MRLRTFLMVLGVLTLIGCATSTKPTETASGPSDADLERSIKTKLASDPTIPTGVIDVSANAAQNEATLSGTVDTEDLRTRVVELAKSSTPNLVVTDKIDVKPPEVARKDFTEDMARDTRKKAKEVGNQIGSSLDDAWIYTKIVAKITANRGTPAFKINVDVSNQSVTLRGEVESVPAKTEVGRIAENTEGVKHVSNLLRVKVS